MIVTLKAEYMVGQITHRPGDVVELDDIKAQALLDLGYAAVADAPVRGSSKKAQPEKDS